MRLYHGGVPGLKLGALIYPDPNRVEHLVDGCPTCEARKAGAPLPDDQNDGSLVYVTVDREYARMYAAGWPLGDLYRVETDDVLADHSDDPAPSWGVASCRVVGVYDRAVRLTPAQIRRLVRRLGVRA